MTTGIEFKSGCGEVCYNPKKLKRTAVDLAIKKTEATVEEYERVFERYLDICNQAIERNKNKFPYSEIWTACLEEFRLGQYP